MLSFKKCLTQLFYKWHREVSWSSEGQLHLRGRQARSGAQQPARQEQ